MTSNSFRFPLAVRRVTILSAVGTLCALSGCHSAFVQTTIVNHTGTHLRLVELDYPSASFGTTNLDANANYHYRFKIQGSGSVKLDFVDAQGKTHLSVGPELDEGQEGTLLVTINETGDVTWIPRLTINK